MSKRLPTGEEQELFETVFKDAKPLKGHMRNPLKTVAPKKREGAKPPPPVPRASKASTAPSGLDGRTAERLRRGELEPEARLDLHGLAEAPAHRTLLTFIKGAQTRGLRLVLVVTGKGSKTPDPHAPFDLELDRRSRGVLNEMTPRWLKEPEMSRLIADVRLAHRRHGGGGALYVYLRKAMR